MTTPPNYAEVVDRLNSLYHQFVGGHPFYVGMQMDAFNFYQSHLTLVMLEAIAGRLKP